MTKTAFITGGSGFLGINIIELLTQNGWKVYALHRTTSNLRYLDLFQVEKVIGSIDDYDSLEISMPEEVDAVFHVAASTNLWSKRNRQQYLDNVVGTQNMIKCANAKRAKRFIHTSSIAAYGLHSEIINEEAVSNALKTGINYSITKYQAEQEVKKAAESGLDAVVMNPANIIGPYDTHNWTTMFRAVFHDKLPGIPPGKGMFCYVKNVAEAHVSAVEKGRTGENYLLGGVSSSYLEVANQIQKLMGRKLTKGTIAPWLLNFATIGYSIGSVFTGKEPLLTPEKTHFVTEDMLCDDSKARQELGFESASLEHMISDTYHWLEKENLL